MFEPAVLKNNMSVQKITNPVQKKIRHPVQSCAKISNIFKKTIHLVQKK